MRAHLWNAIHEMMDAAEYAVEALDNYSDVIDGEYGQPEPNRAMEAMSWLRDKLEILETQMKNEFPK